MVQMDFLQLRYFVAVAEHLNFTEAARHLYVGQPSLSRQIAELEKEIGVQLLIRNNRSVTLTPAGAVLLKHAQRILALTEEAIDKTRKAGSGLIGSLSLGYIFDKELIPELISRFREKYFDTAVNVTKYSWGELIEALVHQEVDVGYAYSYGLEKYPELEYRNIFSTEVKIVMPASHPLASRDKVRLQELADESFIHISRSVSPIAYEATQDICRMHSFSPNIMFESPHTDSILMLVEAGVGLAILPEYLGLYENNRNIRFVNIDGEPFLMHLAFIWNRNNINPSVRLFIQELKEFARFHPLQAK